MKKYKVIGKKSHGRELPIEYTSDFLQFDRIEKAEQIVRQLQQQGFKNARIVVRIGDKWEEA